MPEVVRQKVTVPQLRVGDMLVHCDTVVVGSTRLGDTCEILKRDGGELNIKFETSNGQVMLRHDSDCVVMRVMPTHEEAVAMKERREAELFIRKVVKAAEEVKRQHARVVEYTEKRRYDSVIEYGMAALMAEEELDIWKKVMRAATVSIDGEEPMGMKRAYYAIREEMIEELIRKSPSNWSGGYGTRDAVERQVREAQRDWIDRQRWDRIFG